MSSVTVLHFAALRERRGTSQEIVPIEAGIRVSELYDLLFPGEALRVAWVVNRTRVPGDTALRDGDEVAFLPPLGGG